MHMLKLDKCHFETKDACIARSVETGDGPAVRREGEYMKNHFLPNEPKLYAWKDV